MAEISPWLTDDAIERTTALGRETAKFFARREEIKTLDPNAKVEPHPELLALIAAMGAKHTAQTKPDKA